MKKLTKKIISVILCFALCLSTAAFTAACGHTHVEGEAIRENAEPATCTEDGSYTEVVRCKDCGQVMSSTRKTEPALGHMPTSPVKENIEGYPCVDGKYAYDEVIYCDDCDAEISRVRKSVDGDEHTPGEEVRENEIQSSCFANGGYDVVVYCKGCEKELSRTRHETEKKPHDFDTEIYAKDKTGHWRPCKNAGCSEKNNFEEHTAGAPATATTSQVCTVCDYVIPPPVGHVHAENLTKVPAKTPTCTEDGNIEYYSCSCGNRYADDKAQTLIDDQRDTVVKATGHAFAKDFSSDDTHHWHAAVCAHTAEKEGYEEHTFDSGVTDGGKKIYTCTVCRKTKTVNTHAVTLEYNYDGAPEAITTYIDEGEKLCTPSGFGREMYAVSGWYTDAACANAYDASAPVTSALHLYPKWEKLTDEYVIEAEYIDLTGIKGVGYSNQTQGTGLIQKDEDATSSDGSITQQKAGASNGYYLGYLYKRGITLTFKINSAEATENATVRLSLGAEYWDTITLSCDDFVVKVNDEQMTFDTMTIKGNKGAGYPSEFNDFTVGVGVNLKKGENIITLRVNNTRPMEAAMQATAPLVDCMKIYSDTAISYTPKTSNLDRFDK